MVVYGYRFFPEGTSGRGVWLTLPSSAEGPRKE